MSVKIPPTRRTIRLMGGLAADGATNSMPSNMNVTARYNQSQKKEANVDNIHSIDDVEQHRMKTDELLVAADRKQLGLSSDAMFLSKYYSALNQTSARTESGTYQRSPRQMESYHDSRLTDLVQHDKKKKKQNSVSSFTPRRRTTSSGTSSGGGGGGGGPSTVVPLPPVNLTPRTVKRWQLRHADALPAVDPVDILAAKEEEKRAKQQQSGSKKVATGSRSTNRVVNQPARSVGRNAVPETPRQKQRRRRESMFAGEADAKAAESKKGNGEDEDEVSSWWEEDGRLDEASRQQCQQQLVEFPKLVHDWFDDLEYRAVDFIKENEDVTEFDFSIDKSVANALGTAALRELMEWSMCEPGLSGPALELSAVGGDAALASLGIDTADDELIYHIPLSQLGGAVPGSLVSTPRTTARSQQQPGGGCSDTGKGGGGGGSGAPHRHSGGGGGGDTTPRHAGGPPPVAPDLTHLSPARRAIHQILFVKKLRTIASEWLETHFSRLEADMKDDLLGSP